MADFDWQSLVNIVIAVVSAIGGVKGIDYVRQRRSNGEGEGEQQIVHWTDLTGEQRPIAKGECDARHEALTADLRRGSDKFDKQSDTLDGLRTTLLEMKGEVQTGFAKVEKVIDDAVAKGMDRHERIFHRSGRGTGEYRKQ